MRKPKSISVEKSRFAGQDLLLFRAIRQESIAKNFPEISATAQIEAGVQSDSFREFFLSKNEDGNGILVFEKEEPLNEKAPWLASYFTGYPGAVHNPAVLKASTPLPDFQTSCLPFSLQKSVPIELQFWSIEDREKAGMALTALRATKLLKADNLAIVDQQFERVEKRLTLAVAASVPTDSPNWELKKIQEILPASSVCEQIYSTAQIKKATPMEGDLRRVLYLDLSGATPKQAEHFAKAMVCPPCSAAYVICADNTAEMRKALEVLPSDLFCFSPLECGVQSVTKAFASTLQLPDSVFYVTKKEEKKPLVYWGQSDDVADLGKDGDVSTGDLSRSLGGGGLAPAQGIPAKPKKKPVDHFVDQLFAGKVIKFVKDETKDEQIVYGIVLEPDTVDAQNDIYSAEEVKQAAHKYMMEFQNTGLMHKDSINHKAKVIESYLAPNDFEMGGQAIKMGTWMIAMKVLDKPLWGQIKSGELGGFSIGGSAKRTPANP